MMDTMGTGYLSAKGEVQEQRPAPLRHAHVQAFRNRCVTASLILQCGGVGIAVGEFFLLFVAPLTVRNSGPIPYCRND